MLRALPPDSPLREDLNVIITQIDRISRMIRAAAGSVPSARARAGGRRARLGGGRAPALLQHFAKSRGVNLAVSLPKTLPPVRVDPGHLQQVLINLLTNAIEATPSGGRVRVTGLPQADDGRPGVAIAVQDTGRGSPRTSCLEYSTRSSARSPPTRGPDSGSRSAGISCGPTEARFGSPASRRGHHVHRLAAGGQV
jgi:signal transduction histidine kinase